MKLREYILDFIEKLIFEFFETSSEGDYLEYIEFHNSKSQEQGDYFWEKWYIESIHYDIDIEYYMRMILS